MLDRYMIHKGSVTLDGVSLTVAALDDGTLGVAIIPHTYENTMIRTYAPGSTINVEADLIGKYVEKLMSRALAHRLSVLLIHLGHRLFAALLHLLRRDVFFVRGQ